MHTLFEIVVFIIKINSISYFYIFLIIHLYIIIIYCFTIQQT